MDGMPRWGPIPMAPDLDRSRGMVDLPQEKGRIFGPCRELVSIRRKLHGQDRVLMADAGRGCLACLGIPNPQREVAGSGGDGLPVWCKVDGVHPIFMANTAGHLQPGGRVPQAHSLIERCGRKPTPIG